jgi:acetyl esterase/lipase
MTPTSLVLTDLSFRGYASDVPARLYQPNNSSERDSLLVFLHEGGFVSGGLETADGAARAAAAALGIRVLTIAYSLAPVAPFPAAVEDVWAALAWAASRASRIILGGVEAGGNLAAATGLVARDRRFSALKSQILIAPILDPRLCSDSMRRASVTAESGPRKWFECLRSYLPVIADRMHPYAAPACSRRLAGLAPALVVTIADDPLRDEGETYAKSLSDAGVRNEVLRLPAGAIDLADVASPVWQAARAFIMNSHEAVFGASLHIGTPDVEPQATPSKNNSKVSAKVKK